jgi:hypothetical protein
MEGYELVRVLDQDGEHHFNPVWRIMGAKTTAQVPHISLNNLAEFINALIISIWKNSLSLIRLSVP